MRSITVHQLKDVLAQGEALVVDVREPWEFAEGHVPGARPVPMSQAPTLVGTLPTDQPVYLVCAVGARSGQVAAWLGQQGYDTVNVDGGTQEWVTAGYDEAYISSYLNSNRDSYNHPNAAIEPRIPGIFQYYSVAEDELQKTFAGQNDAQTGANNIAAAWEKLTDQIGRDGQIKLYKASLGM